MSATSQLLTQWLVSLSPDIPTSTSFYQGPEVIYAPPYSTWVVPTNKKMHLDGTSSLKRTYILLCLDFQTGRMLAYTRSERWLNTTITDIENEAGCHWTIGECARLLSTASTFPTNLRPLLTPHHTNMTLEKWMSSPQEPSRPQGPEVTLTANEFFFGVALLLQQGKTSSESEALLHEARQQAKKVQDFIKRTSSEKGR